MVGNCKNQEDKDYGKRRVKTKNKTLNCRSRRRKEKRKIIGLKI